MLSKTTTILLGLIKQQPLNAYEITKVLTRLQVKWWYQIPDSTVYATLRSAGKKQYIQGRLEKEGNMPDKTVYRLTPEGERVLLETLYHFLVTVDYDTVPFLIAVFFIPLLEKQQVLTLLQERQDHLSRIQKSIKAQLESMEAHSLPLLAICNVRSSAELLDAQYRRTGQIIDEISRIQNWEKACAETSLIL